MKRNRCLVIHPQIPLVDRRQNLPQKPTSDPSGGTKCTIDKQKESRRTRGPVSWALRLGRKFVMSSLQTERANLPAWTVSIVILSNSTVNAQVARLRFWRFLPT